MIYNITFKNVCYDFTNCCGRNANQQMLQTDSSIWHCHVNTAERRLTCCCGYIPDGCIPYGMLGYC